MTKKPIEEPVETVEAPRPAAETEPVEIAESDQHPEALRPILTEKEKAEILKEARRKVEAERHAAAKASLLEQEIKRLKSEEGLTSGGVGNQMVAITIDLYPGADSITINQRKYWHGQTYTVPRHVANSLRETMWRGWNAERIRKGDDLASFYAQGRKTVLSATKGVMNAPRTAA